MLHRSTLVALILYSIMAAATAQDQPTNKGPFYPLAIGTHWTYQVTSFDANGKREASYEQTDAIVGVFDFRSGRFACKASTSKLDTYNLWMRNTPRGVEDTGVAWDENRERPIAPVTPNLFIKYPAKVSDTYTTMNDPNTGPAERARVVSVDKEVKVPAGTYRCIEYQFEEIDSNKKLMTLLVAPGVGIVKEHAYDYETGKLVQSMELVELRKANGEE